MAKKLKKKKRQRRRNARMRKNKKVAKMSPCYGARTEHKKARPVYIDYEDLQTVWGHGPHEFVRESVDEPSLRFRFETMAEKGAALRVSDEVDYLPNNCKFLIDQILAAAESPELGDEDYPNYRKPMVIHNPTNLSFIAARPGEPALQYEFKSKQAYEKGLADVLWRPGLSRDDAEKLASEYLPWQYESVYKAHESLVDSPTLT